LIQDLSIATENWCFNLLRRAHLRLK